MTHPEEVVRAKGRLLASPSQWAEWVEQWRGSGLSQRAFCRREGLALATFNRKAVALVGKSVRSDVASEPSEEPPPWLEVRMSGLRAGRVDESLGSLGEGFEVFDGRWRVRLGPQFDAEGLRRLIGVLESLPC